MNERFEQLKRRAVAEADTSHIDFDNMSPTDIRMLGDIAVEKKFAELIVRECIDIVSPYAIRMENFDGGHPVTDLKKHFGVEE